MTSGASDQLARLLSLVPYLLRRPGAKLADVARTFNVSEEQLSRDLNLVYMCGLPGYYPGDLIEVDIASSGRITLSNADAIARPMRLSRDEALPLIVGLRMLADLPGLQDREAVDSVLAKLEDAAEDSSVASAAVAVDIGVDIDAPGPSAQVLATVDEALRTSRRLHLSYFVPSRDETTERDVDPLRMSVVDGRSYLEGWCHRAEAVRLFRLDRITAAVVLELAADPPPEAEPRDLEAGLFQPAPDDVRVVLELAPASRWVAEYYPCESVQPLPGGGTRIELRTPDLRWVRRLALRLGNGARAVEPPELAADIARDAAAALDAYRSAGLTE